MSNRVVHGTYTSAQSGTVLFSGWQSKINAVLFTASAGNSASPKMTVSHAGAVAVNHPGVPAGGGLTFSGLNCGPRAGDITFDCDNPGGTVSVSVFFEAF